MGIKNAFNQLFYGLTTEDRYAEYDTNQHETNNPSNSHLTSQNNSRQNSIQLNDASAFQQSNNSNEVLGSGEGVSETILAWRHIDDWTSENHSDLSASLADPCTKQDIFKAEQDLQISFPPSVRASLRIHDGQEDLESLQGAGGLIYGLKLMSLTEIVEMTRTWRRVTDKIQADLHDKQIKDKLFSPHTSSSEVNLTHHSNRTSEQLVEANSGSVAAKDNDTGIENEELAKKLSSTKGTRLNLRQQDVIPRQQSIPPQTVRPQYCDWNWIPLVTDHSGNHIAVDLNPDVKGTWGQVILFGRDYDTKFVIAKNWGDFLLNFTNDLGQGNYYFDVDEEEDDFYGGEGQLLFKDKRTGRELPYLTVLTTRVITKLRASQPPSQQQPKAPSAQGRKTNVSHIIPGSNSERIVSTDLASKDRVTPEATPKKEEKVEAKEESEAKEAGESEEQKDVKAQEEAQEEEEEEEEEANKSKDIAEDELSNDFKEIAL